MHIFDIIVYSIILAHFGFFLYSTYEIKKGDDCKTLKLVAFLSFIFLVLLGSVFVVLPVTIG